MLKRTGFFVMVLALMFAFGHVSGHGTMNTLAQDAPPADTDGDGIPDDSDACPREPGPRENRGCPVAVAPQPTPPPPGDSSQPPPAPAPADRDGDGITDDVDACPDEAGTTENNGCPEEEAPIVLQPMPAEGRCVVSPAGAYNVNIRSLPDRNADVVGVLRPNDLLPIHGMVVVDESETASMNTSNNLKQIGLASHNSDEAMTWLFANIPAPGTPGWIARSVIRFGGDCPDAYDSSMAAFDPDNLPNLDLGHLVLSPETGLNVGDGMRFQNGDVILDPARLVIPLEGQPFPPDNLPQELQLCSYENNCAIEGVEMIGQMDLDILFCFDDEDLDCIVLEATGTPMANNGDMDILWCPQNDPSTAAGEPGLPATECVEISLNAVPQIPTPANQILCPQLEDGTNPPCVQFDLPNAMTGDTPNDYLWCNLNDPDDPRCWSNGTLLQVELSSMVVCGQDENSLVCDYLPYPSEETETASLWPEIMTCPLDETANTAPWCSVVQLSPGLEPVETSPERMILSYEDGYQFVVNPVLGELPMNIQVSPDIIDLEPVAETTREG